MFNRFSEPSTDSRTFCALPSNPGLSPARWEIVPNLVATTTSERREPKALPSSSSLA